jgi:hypothetical protein
MIQYFTTTFRPDGYEEGASLAITGGRGGARLTHSHERCARHNIYVCGFQFSIHAQHACTA